ncbi:MAG: FAD:protein FMN transferase [Luteimonas sp.]|nr:FAD:protein FMN transferase [Luteimonas sp.]
MGTRWRVCVAAGPRLPLPPLHDAVQATLDRIVAQMSTWEAGSDISRYNRAEAGSWQALPRPFEQVLRCALEVAEASDGAYDPTVGALVELWGFGAGETGPRVPDAAGIDALRARVGWRRITLREQPSAVLQPGGVALDLSAIAKGHGVDAVVACLRERGIDDALVDVGGELFGCGRKPDGAPWRVLVEASPDAADDAPCVLSLDGFAVATSGVHWHRFERAGRTYAHTLDPRSGTPVERAPAAVTVIADDAMRADAWATALTVMGFDAGFDFARAHGIAARFVAADASGDGIRMTPAFAARLTS